MKCNHTQSWGKQKEVPTDNKKDKRTSKQNGQMHTKMKANKLQ